MTLCLTYLHTVYGLYVCMYGWAVRIELPSAASARHSAVDHCHLPTVSRARRDPFITDFPPPALCEVRATPPTTSQRVTGGVCAYPSPHRSVSGPRPLVHPPGGGVSLNHRQLIAQATSDKAPRPGRRSKASGVQRRRHQSHHLIATL